ncbi:MAG TPA: SpoIIE family protein phosphatase [Candidatus Sulfotelmatobacter sp.]|nr:SpoIIE family protein phosphatase [Candidatus Sulfotelmatobacter sp.]
MVLLIAVFVATTIAGPLIGIRQLDAAANAQTRLSNARTDLDGLVQMQLGEETGLRGYVATRDPQFLSAEGQPSGEFDRQAVDLEQRLSRDGITVAVPKIEDLRAAHETWENEVAIPLTRDPGAGDAYRRQAQGKVLTDRLVEDVAAVEQALATAVTGVQQTMRHRINSTVAISDGIVTLFAIVALWYALARSSVQERLDRERTLVDALQRTLRVPGRRLPRTQLGAAYASATREALVGGDLLDVWHAGPDAGWILIGDVSGKGITSARQAAFAQYAVRAIAAEADDPADVVTRFNRLFLDTFEDPGIFVVLFLGAFDARAQTLRYASAGHGTAFVRRGSTVEPLAPTGPIVGLGRDEIFTTATLRLEIGDVVLLATDGLSEARDAAGELLGDERIAAILRDGPADPQALCDLLVASADDFSGGIQDDLAIAALRVVAADEDATTPFSAIGLPSGAVSPK